MANQLNDVLADVIQKGAEAVREGFLFAKTQIPDVIQQLLMWKLVQNLINGVILLAIVVTFITIWVKGYRAYRRQEKTWFCDEFSCFPGVLTAAVGGIVSAFMFSVSVTCFLEAIQIWIAPKIFLIEYAASLLKGK